MLCRKQRQENRTKRHEKETANMTKKTETAPWTGDKDMRETRLELEIGKMCSM